MRCSSIGGIGSGRDYFWEDTKTEVEECDIISSTEWRDENRIADGQRNLELSITVGDETTDYSITIEWTECYFGGKRAWFICPEKNCDERVEKLYRPRGRQLYLCRHCWDLTYKRCNISGNPRKIKGHRLEKIREKLRKKSKKDDYEIGFYLTKPKDMHLDTFLDLEEEYIKLQREYILDTGENMAERSKKILE